MTDTPIYDRLIEEEKAAQVVHKYHERLLGMGLSFLFEQDVLDRMGKGEGFTYRYQSQSLKTTRRHDKHYHAAFRKQYGRLVYRSVVDWKV